MGKQRLRPWRKAFDTAVIHGRTRHGTQIASAILDLNHSDFDVARLHSLEADHGSLAERLHKYFDEPKNGSRLPDNVSIKGFNGHLQVACLNVHWPLKLADAGEKLEDCRHYSRGSVSRNHRERAPDNTGKS